VRSEVGARDVVLARPPLAAAGWHHRRAAEGGVTVAPDCRNRFGMRRRTSGRVGSDRGFAAKRLARGCGAPGETKGGNELFRRKGLSGAALRKFVSRHPPTPPGAHWNDATV